MELVYDCDSCHFAPIKNVINFGILPASIPVWYIYVKYERVNERVSAYRVHFTYDITDITGPTAIPNIPPCCPTRINSPLVLVALVQSWNSLP